MIYVYGASDDLVEVDGDVIDEFPFYGTGHLVLRGGAGELHIWPYYDTLGMWAFQVMPSVDDGEYFNPMPWPVQIDGPTGFGGAPSYSTVVVISNDADVVSAEWVAA